MTDVKDGLRNIANHFIVNIICAFFERNLGSKFLKWSNTLICFENVFIHRNVIPTNPTRVKHSLP